MPAKPEYERKPAIEQELSQEIPREDAHELTLAKEQQAAETLIEAERLDLAVFEETREACNQLIRERDAIIELLEQTTIDTKTIEGVIQLIETLLITIDGARRHTDEIVKRFREHPLKLYIDSSHPLLDTHNLTFNRVPSSLRESFSSLLKTQAVLSLAELDLQQTRDEEKKQTQIIDEERGHLRADADEHIKQGSGVLGFGILPKTRQQRRRSFEQAKNVIATLDEIEKPNHEVAVKKFPDVIQRAPWDIKDELGGLLRKYQTLEQQRLVTVDASNNLQTAQFAYTRTLESFRMHAQKELAGLKLEEAENDITAYQEKIVAARVEIEKFDHFLEQEVFPTLSITIEDERRVRAWPLPENAPEALREAGERTFENIRETVTSYFAYFQGKKKKHKELLRDLQAKLESVRQNAFIGFNDRTEDIVAVLQEKEIKPTFYLEPEHQVRSSTGKSDSMDIATREHIENALGFKKGEHPVYFALGSDRDRERGPAWAYGVFHFKFALEKLRERTVCTIGDSLNFFGVPHSFRRRKSWGKGTSEDQARSRQLILDHGLLAKALFELDNEYEPKLGNEINFNKAVSYVETQVLGPVHISDAEEIVLSRHSAASEINALTTNFSSLIHLTERISEIQPGLSFRIAGKPPTDIRDYHHYSAYARFFKK
ncbi:MAG: hypothetical protein Q8P82_00470 [bacterium]|nr:hypothetical protein [bacterium]